MRAVEILSLPLLCKDVHSVHSAIALRQRESALTLHNIPNTLHVDIRLDIRRVIVTFTGFMTYSLLIFLVKGFSFNNLGYNIAVKLLCQRLLYMIFSQHTVHILALYQYYQQYCQYYGTKLAQYQSSVGSSSERHSTILENGTYKIERPNIFLRLKLILPFTIRSAQRSSAKVPYAILSKVKTLKASTSTKIYMLYTILQLLTKTHQAIMAIKATTVLYSLPSSLPQIHKSIKPKETFSFSH